MNIESLNLKYQSNYNFGSIDKKNINFKSIHLKIPYEHQTFEIQIRYKKENKKFIYMIHVIDSSNILKINTKKEIENL